MNIQEIFNRVIDQEYYDTSHNYSAMCNSLHKAWHLEVISGDEYLFAREQIRNYLYPVNRVYLGDALKVAGLPNTIEARTDIYRDWANRPSLKPQDQAND